MYLRRLHVHGFKTFVTSTEMVVHPGVTAIVGPNGSGKSNVVDALRWVLGEQSLSTLRCRKTEDLIFAGAAGRSQLGMAEVSLTLDNSDRYLDIDFAEATVARRAYRSGENEYLLNKGRVRLKDLAELVAPLRPSQVFVGQGMVDAMLSLRADDRRRMIEEAAQLGLYKMRRADAERQLDRVQANAVRVNDLLAELEPRLRSLKRQAKRTEARRLAEDRMNALTRSRHLRLWELAHKRFSDAQLDEAEKRRAVTGLKEAYAGLQRRLETLSLRKDELEASLASCQEKRHELIRDVEQISKEIAVNRARCSMLEEQRKDIEVELKSVDEAQRDEAAQMAKLQNELAELEQRFPELQTVEQAARVTLTEIRLQWSAQQEGITEKQRQLSAAELEAAGYARERQRLEKRRFDIVAEIEAKKQESAEQIQKGSESALCLEQLKSQLDGAQASLSLAKEAREKASAAFAEIEENSRQVEQELREAVELERAARIRLELARETQDSYAGYPRAVQQLMTNVRKGRATTKLDGLIGTVSELLTVPANYETAIETALGGHAYDIVTERWADAEAAIEYLKRQQFGRCTFLPLDTLKAHDNRQTVKHDGVVGPAIDLISFDSKYEKVFQQVLGNVIVVRDLPTAHRLLSVVRTGSILVTLGGELARTSGSLTGGFAQRTKLLGRMRELRQGLSELKALGQKVGELKSSSTTAQQELAAERERRTAAERDLQAAQESVRRAQAAYDAGAGSAERLRRESDWALSVIDRLDSERKDVEQQIAMVEDSLTRANEQVAAARANMERTRESDYITEAKLDEAAASLRNAESKTAELKAALQRTQALLAVHKENEMRLTERRQNRQQQLEAISRQAADATLQSEKLEEKRVRLDASLRETETTVKPAADAVKGVREEVRLLEEQLETVREQVAVKDDELRAAAVIVERYRSEVEREDEQLGGQGQGPVQSSDPYCELTFEELEKQVANCRAELEQIGPVNWMAEEEYNEAQTRFDFFTSQINDLGAAKRSLQELIEDLDDNAGKRFLATFEVVAAEFSKIFVQLFDGGIAELYLTNPSDGSASGVEIKVQPPGKRTQTLSLLSGGERSLSSIALLFAMLKASPSPFYVLDEVDAALDEVNVRRFAELLQQLATETQFIVITHNRATMEAADILYGVFMGANSTSRMISLSLAEAQKAAASAG